MADGLASARRMTLEESFHGTSDVLADVKVSFVVARTRNAVIGCSGKMPWRLKTDMAHFKKVTMGKPVVMGRKTWDSLSGPLPGRDNVVLSRSLVATPISAWVYSEIEAALQAARAMALRRGVHEICIVGGEEVFSQLIDRVDRIYLTDIDAEIEGDTHFPSFDEAAFVERSSARHSAGVGDEYAVNIRLLERRS